MDGSEWVGGKAAERVPEVWVRVWYGKTAVAHHRSDLNTAHAYVTAMRGQLPGVRYTIAPLPSFAPPTRPLPTWQPAAAAL